MKTICMLFIMALFAVSTYADGLGDMLNGGNNSTTTNGLKGVKSTGFSQFKGPDFIVNGKVYKNHEITGCSADGVEISYDGGVATVALKDWPASFAGDLTAKIKSRIALLKNKRDETEKEELENKTVESSVAVKKLPPNTQCLIFKIIGVENGAVLGMVNAKEWEDSKSRNLKESVNLVSGLPQYEKHLKEFSISHSKSGKDFQESLAIGQLAEEIEQQNPGGIVYVTDLNTENYVDGQQIVIGGIRSGVHKYVAVNGAARTVPKFTAVKQ